MSDTSPAVITVRGRELLLHDWDAVEVAPTGYGGRTMLQVGGWARGATVPHPLAQDERVTVLLPGRGELRDVPVLPDSWRIKHYANPSDDPWVRFWLDGALAATITAADHVDPSGVAPTPAPADQRGCYGCDTGTTTHNLYCPNRYYCCSLGPRIGDGAPSCVERRDHTGDHRADPSWGDVTWPNPAAPAPRQQWAVQHPQVRTTAHDSPHSTLYTLSRLPGGVIVTRHHPDEPWTPTTECMCGGQRRDDGGHFQGCPVRVSGGGQP